MHLLLHSIHISCVVSSLNFYARKAPKRDAWQDITVKIVQIVYVCYTTVYVKRI